MISFMVFSLAVEKGNLKNKTARVLVQPGPWVFGCQAFRLEIQLTGKPGGSPSQKANMLITLRGLTRCTPAATRRCAAFAANSSEFSETFMGLGVGWIGCAASARSRRLHRLAQMIKTKLSTRKCFSPAHIPNLWDALLVALTSSA
jgi:hypothetical protein